MQFDKLFVAIWGVGVVFYTSFEYPLLEKGYPRRSGSDYLLKIYFSCNSKSEKLEVLHYYN